MPSVSPLLTDVLVLYEIIQKHWHYETASATLPIYSKLIMPYLVILVFLLSTVVHSCQPLFYASELDKGTLNQIFVLFATSVSSKIKLHL